VSDTSPDRARTSGLIRTIDRIIDAGAFLAAALLIAVMLATTIKVVFRYGLREGLIGVDQISGTMLLYIAFLGAAWVLRREEHVTLDIVLNSVRPTLRRRMLIASSVLGGLICLTLALAGTVEVISSLQRGIKIPSELEMPRAVNLVVIPLGCFFLGLQFLRRAWLFANRPGSAPAPSRGAG
jgi:TRAP-type C4-dicarboxylate transport system permease small subunit